MKSEFLNLVVPVSWQQKFDLISDFANSQASGIQFSGFPNPLIWQGEFILLIICNLKHNPLITCISL